MADNEKLLIAVQTTAQTLLQIMRETELVVITPALIAEKIDHAASVFPNSLTLSNRDRDAAIAELIRRFSHWIGKDTVLENSEGHVAWLDTNRKRDWHYWARYQEYLGKSMSLDVVGALDKSTDEILRRLEDPTRTGIWDRRGLVVGHVQSGKTGNYSGLVCKAADAGYKIIIVLAGLHNNLRSQTQIRLEESFLGYKTADPTGSKPLVGVGLLDSHGSMRPNCATTRADNGDFSKAVAKNLAVFPEERPWLFVVKKQKTVLTDLLKWIRSHVAEGVDTKTTRRTVMKFPLLVIDDEADNASVDTGAQLFDADGHPDEEHNPKAINGLIRKVLNQFDRAAYVGYTATPFANIFIHRRGATAKEGPDLFPEAFIINLAAPSNYVGPSQMFGLRTTDGRIGGLPLARYITDHVDKDNPKKGWMPEKHKTNHAPVFSGTSKMPPSLVNAIHSFVLACAARICRGQGKEHSSMLIHVTRLTNVQGLVRQQVDELVNGMRQKMSYRLDSEDLIANLLILWEKDFIPTSEAVAKLFPENADVQVVPKWNEILEALPIAIGDIVVREINGLAKDALDYAENQEIGLKVIAIGGDKLSRGLTLEGLCTSYFVRTTKMYDTLMQMGRWFGYRPGYVDLCRLYTSEDLVEWFGHIADASEELREEFDAMAERNATPATYGLRVKSHPVLLVTSPLKMRTAKNLELSFSGELLETVSLFKDPIKLRRNLATTQRLLEAMGPPSQRSPTRIRDGAEQNWIGTFLWEGVDPEAVAEFFEAYITHPNARKVNSNLLSEFVRKMVKSNELTSWTVVLMGGGQGKKSHTFGETGLTLDMLKRSDESPEKDRYSIGRLLSPRDEAIDLDANAWAAALAETRRTWKGDATKQKRSPEEPDTPNGPAIRRVRGKGAEGVAAARERGLLLVYPLAPASGGGDGFNDYNEPVIAFGVSFPASDNGVKVTYAVDHLLWQEQYGSGE